MKIILYIFCLFVICGSQKPLPHYIKACSKSDKNINKCFETNANYALKYIAEGDAKYKIDSLKPFKWNEIMQFVTPKIEIIFYDIVVYGGENFTITNPKVDLLNNNFKFHFENPLIIWEGNYNAKVKTDDEIELKNGRVQLKFHNGVFLMSYFYELLPTNGIQFAKITKWSEEVLATDIKFHSDDKNGLTKKEWNEVKLSILSEKTLDVCAKTVGEFIKRIFDVVPFNEIFTE